MRILEINNSYPRRALGIGIDYQNCGAEGEVIRVVCINKRSVHFWNRENCLVCAKRLLNKVRYVVDIPCFGYLMGKPLISTTSLTGINDRWLCAGHSDIHRAMHTEFPSTAVLTAVSKEGYAI